MTATVIVPNSGVFDGNWYGHLTLENIPQTPSIKAMVYNDIIEMRLSIATVDGNIYSQIYADITEDGKIHTTSKFTSIMGLGSYLATVKLQFVGDQATGTLDLDGDIGKIVLRRVAAEARRKKILQIESERQASLLSNPFDGRWSGRVDCSQGGLWYTFTRLPIRNGRLNAWWNSSTSKSAFKFDGNFDDDGHIEINGQLTFRDGKTVPMQIIADAIDDKIEGWGSLGVRGRNCKLVLTRD